jgi:hypothetical protein
MTYAVCQTQPDGTSKVLYQGLTQREAQREVDRINDHLDARGIPGWVSSAYVA